MAATDKHDPRLWAPRYWPSWVGFGVLRLLVLLPYPLLMRLGRALGRTIGPRIRSRREIAETNLRACFPELDAQQRAGLLRRHFESLGMAVFEMPLGWWKSRRALEPLAHVQGLEHLQAAMQRGKGVILLSAHFTSLEITGRLLSFHVPFHPVYRRHENPVVEYVMGGVRHRVTSNAIPSKNPRGILRSLKGGNNVWYALDRNTGRRQAAFVDFFGQLAATNVATSRIARITGAAVVPFCAVRRAGGDGYDLVLEPALADFPSDDVQHDTQRISDMIERWVREHPEQYLWIHRRFRTRPHPDDPPFYARPPKGESPGA